MKTDELIDGLAERLSPVNKHSLSRALLLTLGAGGVLSFALMAGWLGIRPDLEQAMGGVSFWMKFAYTLALAVAGFFLAEQLARPIGSTGKGLVLAILTILVMTVAAIAQIVMQPEAMRALLMGASWQVCARNILVVSIPLFAAIFLVMRRFAPTRIASAGAAAGLLAGAAGALVYGFHCDESAAPSVLIWYSLGMLAVTAIGALVAKAGALRW